MIKFIGDGEFLTGIPARDLTPEEWEGLTTEQRETAVASKLYVLPEKKPAKKEVRHGR